MFDNLRLLGPSERNIIVQTRKGRSLTAIIVPEPEFQHVQSYRLLLKKYGTNWLPRKPSMGVYNCAGHIWASRRAALPEENEWRKILDDDGYRRLVEGESPYPDDIVVYVEKPYNEIMHVARVVELRAGITPDSPCIPWAISKWDLKSGEVMHSVNDVPYKAQYGEDFDFKVEFWTDRPVQRRTNNGC